MVRTVSAKRQEDDKCWSKHANSEPQRGAVNKQRVNIIIIAEFSRILIKQFQKIGHFQLLEGSSFVGKFRNSIFNETQRQHLRSESEDHL